MVYLGEVSSGAAGPEVVLRWSISIRYWVFRDWIFSGLKRLPSLVSGLSGYGGIVGRSLVSAMLID